MLSLNGRVEATTPWLLALGPALLLVALFAPYRWLFYLGYAYLLVMLAGYSWVRWQGPRVQVRRRLHTEWAQVGDHLEEAWQLENDSALPLLWLAIEDTSTLAGYNARRIVATSGYGRDEWRTDAVCTKRGVYQLGPFSARLGDPFGLFRFHWQDSATRQIVIYPPLVVLPPLQFPQGQRGGMAQANVQQQYATPSVGGLRPYVPGDMLSHVHWPTFARTNQLMVKEFDQERAGALWIVVDLQRAEHAIPATAPVAEKERYSQSSLRTSTAGTSATTSPVELAITLACSLAAQALAEGRAVGLLADDGRRRLITPGRGPRQLWRILSELVDAREDGTVPLETLLREGQQAHANEIGGAGVVVITPALGGAWLPALGMWLRGRTGGALALLVASAPEQAGPIIAQLAAGGTRSNVFTVGTPLPLLNPPRTTVERVSPLGRIVRG